MMYKEILIRYGELSTKGRNKKDFIYRLRENIRYSFSDLAPLKIRTERDRMFIETETPERQEQLVTRLPKIFGIQSFSLVASAEKDMQAIKAVAHTIMAQYGEVTFKVEVKRSDKSFHMDTHEIQRDLGGYLLSNFQNLSVDVKKPQVPLRVEIREDAAYIMAGIIKGAGGMPVGSNGKSLLMLSGGIDSPVAAYLMMKRGVRIEAIHFFSPPYTSQNSLQKVMDLTNICTQFGARIRLHIIPFTEIQTLIKDRVPENLSMTTTRRMMLKVADKVRQEIDALGIVTGESLGQVASQTLHSMTAINEVTSTPVLRPLLSYDKNEIIDIAKEIGTYETSIQPYEDCCTVFTPANPATKPKLEKVEYYESMTEFDDLIDKAVRNREMHIFPRKEQKADKFAALL